MDVLSALGAADLRAVAVAFRDALAKSRDVVNRLNVYPVPDGDTGSNMFGTVEAVAAELSDTGDTMGEVCHAISHGSLMGARGNSGIIICQVLRGLTGVFREHDAITGPVLARALTEASTQADQAVARPVEGTILSVVRASAQAATAAADDDDGAILPVAEAAREAAVTALARTPEQLPVLAQAGVVDAGGAGFSLLLDGLLSVIDGRPLPEHPAIPDDALAAVSNGRTAGGNLAEAGIEDFDANDGERPDDHKDISELKYEVMYFLEAPDAAIAGFRDVWTGLGDSIVVVGGDGLWNCHIHTDEVGPAIEAGIEAGRPRNIRVTDLLEELAEPKWVAEAEPAPEQLPHQHCGVVAVASGEGLRRILHSFKVHQVVHGGQTMNPSTAELLTAVDSLPADQVVILPNNKNIIPVARQAAEMATKPCHVVPTKGVPEGFAALLDYDPEVDADQNARCMTEAAERVVTGEVTRAVRASQTDIGAIAADDWLGLTADEGIVSIDANLAVCLEGLLDNLVDEDHEILTLIEGEGATPASTRLVTQWLSEHRPSIEVEIHHGGQPLYPYLFSVE